MTNPMTTTGDTIYSSSGSTPARLGIGSANQLLRVNSGGTAPEWATISTGGMTLLSTTTLSGATTTISSISGSYNNLQIVVLGATNNTANGVFGIEPNSSASISQNGTIIGQNLNESYNNKLFLCDPTVSGLQPTRTQTDNGWVISIFNYASTTQSKVFSVFGAYRCDNLGGANGGFRSGGIINTTSAITELLFRNTGGTFSAGTVLVYGVK
jgi:hypothetical protein